MWYQIPEAGRVYRQCSPRHAVGAGAAGHSLCGGISSSFTSVMPNIPCLPFQFHFQNPTFSPKPRLQRQDKLFVKHKGKVLRPFELGTNIAAWSRLLKKEVPQLGPDERSLAEPFDLAPPPPPSEAAAVLAAELKHRLSREGSPENATPVFDPKARRRSTDKKVAKAPTEQNGQSEDASKALAAFTFLSDEKSGAMTPGRKVSVPEVPERQEFTTGRVVQEIGQLKFSTG